MTRIRSLAVAGLLPLLGLAPVAGFSQDPAQPYPEQPVQPYPAQPTQPYPAPVAAAPPEAVGAPAAPLYSVGQLDQMLAPIALYPDSLLTQILMASTFPIQIVEAERWLQNPANAALRGDALVAALQPVQWDPSVKSLVPFPQILKLLNDQLDYTQSLGTAFANQQGDVMEQVQVLRAQAESAGKLASTPQLRVVHEGPAVVIEPADPAVIYVPVYNPVEIYGPWAYAAYPPLFFPPPAGFFVGTVGIGIGFSVGFGVVGPLWGFGHPAWGERNIVINNEFYSRISYNHAAFVGGASWHHVGPVGFVGGFHPGAGFRGGAAGFHGTAAGFRGAAPGFHGPAPAFRGSAGHAAAFHPPAAHGAGSAASRRAAPAIHTVPNRAPPRAPVSAARAAPAARTVPASHTAPAAHAMPAVHAAHAAPPAHAAPGSHGASAKNQHH